VCSRAACLGREPTGGARAVSAPVIACSTPPRTNAEVPCDAVERMEAVEIRSTPGAGNQKSRTSQSEVKPSSGLRGSRSPAVQSESIQLDTEIGDSFL